MRLLLPLFQSTSLAQSRQTAFKPIRCVWFAIAGAAAGTPAATAFIAATVGGTTIGAATVTGSTGRRVCAKLGRLQRWGRLFRSCHGRHTTAAPLRRVPSPLQWSQPLPVGVPNARQLSGLWTAWRSQASERMADGSPVGQAEWRVIVRCPPPRCRIIRSTPDSMISSLSEIVLTGWRLFWFQRRFLQVPKPSE